MAKEKKPINVKNESDRIECHGIERHQHTDTLKETCKPIHQRRKIHQSAGRWIFSVNWRCLTAWIDSCALYAHHLINTRSHPTNNLLDYCDFPSSIYDLFVGLLLINSEISLHWAIQMVGGLRCTIIIIIDVVFVVVFVINVVRTAVVSEKCSILPLSIDHIPFEKKLSLTKFQSTFKLIVRSFGRKQNGGKREVSKKRRKRKKKNYRKFSASVDSNHSIISHMSINWCCHTGNYSNWKSIMNYIYLSWIVSISHRNGVLSAMLS